MKTLLYQLWKYLKDFCKWLYSLTVHAKGLFILLISFLKDPSKWLYSLKLNKQHVLSLIIYLMIGCFFQQRNPFPNFYLFVGLFLFIGIISLTAEHYFCKEMVSLLHKKPQQNPSASSFFLKRLLQSGIFCFIPLTITFIFGTGGCMMFGALSLTPTLIWIMILFAVVVYISIIGYLQYFILAYYIVSLAKKDAVLNFREQSASILPADTEWLQQLTNLSHNYRSAFFTLGCAYIIAFVAFCFLPDMHANIHSYFSVLLWGIIFFAIVMTFPIVSILEYLWIKKIVTKLKNAYLKDLEEEVRVLRVSDHKYIAPLVKTVCSSQILNSPQYPRKSVLSTGYAVILSAVNFMVTIIALCKEVPTLINAAQQIF